jgi:hypothetical protein
LAEIEDLGAQIFIPLDAGLHQHDDVQRASSWRRPGSRWERDGTLPDAGHSTKLMALGLSKGFHRHDEVLLGFIRNG